jgi:hypothetical protein
MEVGYVPMGKAQCAMDVYAPIQITHKFFGRKSRLSVEEAEQLRDDLNDVLSRSDLRRPITVVLSTEEN